MRLVQYPYKLQVKTITGGGQNENGDFIPSTEKFEDLTVCRDQANISGRQIKLADGTAIVFDTIIHAPKGTGPISEGTVIRVVENSGVVRVEGEVLRSNVGQLHTRLWL